VLRCLSCRYVRQRLHNLLIPSSVFRKAMEIWTKACDRQQVAILASSSPFSPFVAEACPVATNLVLAVLARSSSIATDATFK
jgi:hypothetical protein